MHNTCSWKTILANAKSGNIDDLFSKFHLSVINAELDIVQRKALFDKIAQLGNKSNDFIRDFAGNSDALKAFATSDELVDAWKVLEGSTELRKNIDALETVAYYKKHINSNIDELSNSFKFASNKEDWFSSKIAEIRSKARNLPGTSSGNGVAINGKWMRGTEGNVGLFPRSVADKLKGKHFNSFDEFRNEFWKAVADDPKLFAQFGRSSQAEMLKGNAPFAKKVQQVGGRIKYEIHHKTPIHDGGSVYDVDNLVIITPRYHKEILDPAYHFKKK